MHKKISRVIGGAGGFKSQVSYSYKQFSEKEKNFHGTIFFNSDFTKCDLSKNVFTDCMFSNCKFYDNKLIKSVKCLFSNCVFSSKYDMDLYNSTLMLCTFNNSITNTMLSGMSKIVNCGFSNSELFLDGEGVNYVDCRFKNIKLQPLSENLHIIIKDCFFHLDCSVGFLKNYREIL